MAKLITSTVLLSILAIVFWDGPICESIETLASHQGIRFWAAHWTKVGEAQWYFALTLFFSVLYGVEWAFWRLWLKKNIDDLSKPSQNKPAFTANPPSPSNTPPSNAPSSNLSDTSPLNMSYLPPPPSSPSKVRCFLLKLYSLSLQGLAVLVASGLAVHLIKFLIGRKRPHVHRHLNEVVCNPWDFRWFEWDWRFQSFPSGHSQLIFTVATFLAFHFPHRSIKILVFGVALSVALTRIFTLDHFLSDVLCGSLVGYMVTTLILERQKQKRLGAKGPS